MSEIQCLPVEVLCCIFDQFTGRERRPLYLVCAKWYQILTTKRYVLRRRIKVNPENVELFEACGNDLRKYHCVSIRDDESNPKSRSRRMFLNLIGKVMFSTHVVGHLEELTLEGVQSDLLQDLFGESCEECRFPNLKSLSLRCFEFGSVSEIRRWKIPDSLTKLEISVSNTEEVQLIEVVANQLEELYIECSILNLLLKCCDIPNFQKLRTLRLKSDTFFPERFSSPSDIGDNFVSTLKRLKNLAVGFRHNDFLLGYEPLLQHCHGLESLSIFGADLSVSASNTIGQLHNLKKLELLLRIEKDSQLIPWNLQNLTNVHTYVENLAPLGDNLPALKTIRISNHTIREGRFSIRPIERTFLQRYFIHFESICKLFLYDIYLEEDLLLQFPKMKIKEIILRCVRTSSLILDIIYERAPEILDVYFWDCCFLASPRAKIPAFGALGLLLPHVRISHSSSKIIAVDYGQILS